MRDVFGLVGTTLKQQYRIDGVVGEGGFGVVYRGVHLGLEQAIAVKVLKVPAHFSTEAQHAFQTSFRAEGKLLAKLSEHRSIVRVYDLDLVPTARGEVPYLVLEWLEGQDLESWIEMRRAAGLGPLSEAEAVEKLAPALDALSAAHRLGVAHRDIKPANLFSCETALGPTLKVLDFGIAKVMQEGETATQAQSATAGAFRAFSPHYGAPEQFAPKRYGATGPWTDVHAMGLILSELVSGKRPFEGEELFELMHSGLQAERPTPRALGAQVSAAFEAAVAKALSLDRTQRHASAGELWTALQEALRAPAVPATAVDTPVAPTVVMGAASGTVPLAPPTAAETPVAPTVAMGAASGTVPVAPRPVAVSPPVKKTVPVKKTEVLAGERSGTSEPASMPAGAAPRRSMLPWALGLGGIAVLGALVAAIALGAAGEQSSSEPWAEPEVPALEILRESQAAPERSAPPPSDPPSEVPVRAEPSRPALVCPEGMVSIPGGTFEMGTASGGDDDERPVTRVTLSPYCLDRTEVTVSAYRQCVTAGSCTGANTGGNCNYGRSNRGEHPINCVEWSRAEAYCRWRGGRLPTEAEWEYAARGTDGRTYPWGNEPSSERLRWNSNGTSPVASHPSGASPFGVQDLAGNVEEWVADWYGPYPGGTTSNPQGAYQGQFRVSRGGGWFDRDPSRVRAAFRHPIMPANPLGYVGFRCARGGS